MIHKQESSPNPHPPRPQLFPPPQNKRIKIIHKQEFPPMLNPEPQPLLHPQPQAVLSLRPQPQPALKSPIKKPPEFLFTVHNMPEKQMCECKNCLKINT